MNRLIWTIAVFSCLVLLRAQEPAAQKPTEHVLGTVTGVDKTLHTVTVKDDAAGNPIRTIQVGETKTLLKVAPGAKDIKGATRITADDLEVGDRVDVRGFKVEADPNAIAARSVLLMSARDVQQAHEMESDAWKHAMAGVVAGSDATSQKLTVTVRGAAGPRTIQVNASHAQFTRFSPETPQTPTQSQFADIQAGDQVRILSDKAGEASGAGEAGPASEAVTAQKIYSGSFKNTAGTVVSLAADGKSLVIKDLATKQPVNVSLAGQAAVHRMPQPMAAMLARRLNPAAKAEGGEQNPEAGAGRMRGNGDLSQMLERLPKITLSELKPGDAIVVSGSPLTANKSTLLATTIIAGVEPIFQSASPRQAQSLGDWGSGLGGGAPGEAAAGGGAPPQ